jgi:hypothetical protein
MLLAAAKLLIQRTVAMAERALHTAHSASHAHARGAPEQQTTSAKSAQRNSSEFWQQTTYFAGITADSALLDL